MNSAVLPKTTNLLLKGKDQNIPLKNETNNSAIIKKKDDTIIPLEQNINPNRTEINKGYSTVKSKIKSSYKINTQQNNKTSNGNISLSKTMVHQSPIINKGRAIEMDQNLESSGKLLTSSRSSKYNKVIKNGKKIRNIDINNESEDNQNEDTESIISNVNKNDDIINHSLKSSSGNIKDTKKNNLTAKVTQIKVKDNNSESDNQISSKIKEPKEIEKSKFYKQKNDIINDENKSKKSEKEIVKNVKEKQSNAPLNSKTEIIPNKSKQNIKINNQSLNELKPNANKLNEKIPENLNNNKSSVNQNQYNSLTQPANNLSQLQNNLHKNQITPLYQDQKSRLNAQYDKISNNSQSSGDLGDKISESIKNEDEKISNISNNNNGFQQLKESPNNDLYNSKNPSGSYLVTHLDEYLKNEIDSDEFHPQENLIPKKEKGFRLCSELTKAGKNAEGKTKIDQDTPLICLSVGGIIGFNLFGVLDGHGPHGHFVSQFCKEYFIKNMTNYIDSLKITMGLTSVEELYMELKRCKFNYIIELYNQVDIEIASQTNFDYKLSGTTCNIIFQFNKHLVGCNVGDSRSLLIYDKGDYKNQGIYPLSTDHKPNLPDEYERITLCGGRVDQITDIFGYKIGPSRVYKTGFNYPGLAMSRSLGDFEAKAVGVISTPEIIEYEVNSNSKYLIVCSDGVWEFAKNEQIRDIANIFYEKNDIGGLCTELVKFSMSLWEKHEIIRDDITVVAVFF